VATACRSTVSPVGRQMTLEAICTVFCSKMSAFGNMTYMAP
jgi:hypothetical protein